MERYLSYLINMAVGAPAGHIQPVYGIDGRARLDECEIESLPGYRGMGPVRIGNQAYEQSQHDVYGSAILAVAHVFSTVGSHTRVGFRFLNDWNPWETWPLPFMISRTPVYGKPGNLCVSILFPA